MLPSSSYLHEDFRRVEVSCSKGVREHIGDPTPDDKMVQARRLYRSLAAVFLPFRQGMKIEPEAQGQTAQGSIVARADDHFNLPERSQRSRRSAYVRLERC